MMSNINADVSLNFGEETPEQNPNISWFTINNQLRVNIACILITSITLNIKYVSIHIPLTVQGIVYWKLKPEEDTVKHPVAVFFHLIFRFLAIVTYLLCGIFSSGFIINFIIIILLLSMDFWTVKNITGRLLVGLRWWNYVDEEGVSHWVFESRKGAAKSVNTNGESRVFWLSLVVSQVFWTVFVFAALLTLSFKWLMVASLGVVLNGSNLYGYVRCKMGSRQKLSSVAKNFVGQQVLGSMLSSFASTSSGKQQNAGHE